MHLINRRVLNVVGPYTLAKMCPFQILRPLIIADAEVVIITPSEASPRSEAAESSEFQSEKDAVVEGKDAVVEEVPSEGDGAEPEALEEQTTEHVGEATFSYDRLISKSTDPIRGIDYKRREVCSQETSFYLWSLDVPGYSLF